MTTPNVEPVYVTNVMTTAQQVENALAFLSTSAQEFAEAKGLRVYLEEQRKIVKATIFGMADGGVAEREAFAYSHADYRKVVDELRRAVVTEELLRAKRAAADARIEVWRSQESSRRAANVV